MAAALYTANVMAQKDTLSTTKQTFDLGKGVACDLREMTGAVSTATADALSHRNSIKASNQLYGMLPGLTALQNKGTAWESAATFYVRGLGTLSERAPLVIVDSIERSIDELSSEEIESVSVLKDAAATAIYGVRGGNGVILVRTKRGSSGAPQINVSYEFNMGKPIRLPKMVDGYTYAQALNEAMHNDGLDPFYSQKELEHSATIPIPTSIPMSTGSTRHCATIAMASTSAYRHAEAVSMYAITPCSTSSTTEAY